MKAIPLLLVILSNQGYWFGGQASTVQFRWAVEGNFPETVVVWNLMFGDVRVAGERIGIRPGDYSGLVSITPPKVRVRTLLRLVYRLETKEEGKILAEGEEKIHVFPQDLSNGIASHLENKKIIVLDKRGEIAGFLKDLKIPFVQIDRLSALQLIRSDILLVGPNEVDAAPLMQEYLLEQARSGGQVFIFEQITPKTLLGYPLIPRTAPSRLEWRLDHPLFNQFQLADVQSWIERSKKGLRPVELPPDEPALEVAWWPREIPGKAPVPIDALLAVKSLGRGRVVLCQIPLGPWREDPRTQLFWINVFDYLMTRPEPTLRPSERKDPGTDKIKKVKIPSHITY